MRGESLLCSIIFLASVASQQPPSKVQGVTVTRTVQGSSPALRVSWSAVSGSGRRGITYTVCYSTNRGSKSDPPSGARANCHSGTSGITGTFTTLGPVSRNTTYYIWVRAESSGGRGPYSDRVQQNACNGISSPVPSRPTIATVAPTSHSRSGFGLFISWKVPTSHCLITSYKVQHKMSSDTSWSTQPVSVLPPKTYHNLIGLSSKTSYDVRVRAVSEAGKGEWSGVGQTTTHGVPGPVRSLSATPLLLNGMPALNVSWSPPVDKAQGGLTYRLRVVPPNVTISRPTRATQYNVTGLRANTRYTVYVSAGSAAVYGPEVFTVATTVVRPPSFTVTQLTGQLLSTSSVTLRISPSVGSQYVVFYKEDGQQFTKHPTTFSSTNNVVITGLQSNTGYTMRVQASNDYGSTNSSGVDVYTLPEGPTDLILSPLSSTSILCSWTPPVNHRKTPLMYAVSHVQSGAVSTAETSLTLTELQPYKEYTISVKAQNRRGSSVPVTGTVRTYSDTPSGQPQFITNSTKRTSWIEIKWTIPPAGGRNGIIINYVIDLISRDENISIDVQTPTFSTPENLYYNITGLSAGSEYTVRVAASTVNGTGPFTGEVRIRTLDDVPGPVRNLTFEVIPQSEGSVRISWVAPAVTNGDIVSYEVTYGVLDGTDMKLIVSNPPVVLTNLTDQTPYRVGVRAGTSQGFGDVASIVVFSSEGVPIKAVDSVTVEWATVCSVLVTWTPLSYIEARGFPLYHVTYTSDDGSTSGSVNTTSSSVAIAGLDSQNVYIFTVQVSTRTGNNKGGTEFVLTRGQVSPTQNDNTAAFVGVLIGGMTFGAVAVLLVEGIVCGVCKLRQHPKRPTSNEPANKVEAIYEVVDEDPCPDVTMTTSPAYEGVKIN